MISHKDLVDMLLTDDGILLKKRYTGGSSYEVFESKHSRETESLYELFRERKDEVNAAIAENTRIKREKIDAIYEHIFEDEHWIARFGGELPFDQSNFIAKAWQRLYDGYYTREDLLLIKHEWLEIHYLQTLTSDYEEAHTLSNIKYNWEERIFNLF